MMFFGYALCLDSFLHTFTILPIRVLMALNALLLHLKYPRVANARMTRAQQADLSRGAMLLLSIIILGQVDASRLYHSVRGQSVFKLYVVFNVLEIGDKLCSSFGHDVLDAYFVKLYAADSAFLPLYFILSVIYISTSCFLLTGSCAHRGAVLPVHYA
jgi:hypothetical protein